MRWFEQLRDCPGVVPKSLRIDVEAISLHHLDLSLERQVVGILGDDDHHSNCDRVARAWEQLERRRRGHDGAAALTACFLALDLLDHELATDDVDFFALFELIFPLDDWLFAVQAEGGCSAIDLHQLIDAAQRWLVLGTMTRLLFFGTTAAGTLVTLLGRLAEQRLVASRRLLLELLLSPRRRRHDYLLPFLTVRSFSKYWYHNPS